MLARLFFLCSLLLAASVPVQSQIPAPFYSLTFATQPSAAANGTAGYTWEQFDQSDVACGISQYHQGLIVLSGGPSDTTATPTPTVTPYGVAQYLNLSASSGPYNVDSVMPVIFGNSSAGGWTVEVTFKAGIQETWGKLIDLGSTRPTANTCNNDFYLGWNGNSQNWATGSCDSAGNSAAGVGNNNFGGLFVEGAWYHIVIVLTQLGDGMTLGNGQGNWTMYVNGVQAGSLFNTSYPQAAVRQNAVIGNSNWGDSLWAGLLDTFNVYNAPLTATQVASLSASALGSSTPTVACTAASTATTVPAGAVFYTNTFNTNPITALAITNPTYQWASNDASDSTANQTLHTGLLLLNGSNPIAGFANMTATSGGSAVSSTPLGFIGGQGTGSISDGTLGWSFEVVYKPFHIDSFGKLYDISNGNGTGGVDDILYGYNSDKGDYECDYVSTAYYVGSGNQQILSPAGPAVATLQLGSWYHHIWVMQYNATSSVAASNDRSQYYGYLNGNLINTLNNAVYPPLLQRNNAFLGRSSWNDSAWQGYVDTFRVYSVALTAGQVQTLYQQAMVTGVPSNAPGASSSSSGVAAPASSSSVSAASAVSAASSSSAASAASAVSAVSSSAASAASAVSSSAASAASAVSSSAVSAASAVSSSASAASAVSSSASAAVSSSSAASAAVATQSSSASTAAAGTKSSSSSAAAASVSSSPSTAATQGVTSSSSPSTPVVVASSSSSPAAAASVTSSSTNVAAYVTSASSSSSVAVPVVLSSSSSSTGVPPQIINGASSQSSGLVALMVAVMAVLALLL